MSSIKTAIIYNDCTKVMYSIIDGDFRKFDSFYYGMNPDDFDPYYVTDDYEKLEKPFTKLMGKIDNNYCSLDTFIGFVRNNHTMPVIQCGVMLT